MAEAKDDETTYGDLTGDNVLRLNTMNSGLTVPSTSSRIRNSPSQVSSQIGGTSLRQRPSRLSKYGVSFEPPQDDAVHYPADARSVSFFEKVIHTAWKGPEACFNWKKCEVQMTGNCLYCYSLSSLFGGKYVTDFCLNFFGIASPWSIQSVDNIFSIALIWLKVH